MAGSLDPFPASRKRSTLIGYCTRERFSRNRSITMRATVSADRKDFFVGQIVGLVAKQFAATLDRDQRRGRVFGIYVVHTPPHIAEPTNVCSGMCALQHAGLSARSAGFNRADVGRVPTSIRRSARRSVRDGCG